MAGEEGDAQISTDFKRIDPAILYALVAVAAIHNRSKTSERVKDLAVIAADD